jgi:hypothetical protein
MVLGIGEGKIEIVLEKQGFSSGEKLKGKVRLSLNQSKKAKELRVKFYGEKHVGSGKHHHVDYLYQQEIKLDGEKEYPGGTSEYSFELQLPAPERPVQGEGVIAGVLGFLAGDPWAHVKWYLDASLSLPMSFDINKKIQISFVF